MSAVTVIFLVVHLLQFCLGFAANYQGFDDCGMNNWHCSSDGVDFEVTFECDSNVKDARLWIWTARVPKSTTVFSVKNCRRVELHMDCTMGYRSYNLKRFHADNITSLELLRPMRPHVFLHDNDMYSQSPPELFFTNIQALKWYPENFEAAGGRCRRKTVKLQKLVFDNVLIGFWASHILNEQNLKMLYLSGVRFRNMQPGSLTVDGNILIKDSQLDDIAFGNLDFKCNEMAINSSSINKIASGAISVTAKYFSFINNVVTHIEGKAFQVSALTTRIVNNTWKSIGADAFTKIRPNGSCLHGNVYEFRENHVEFLENGFAPDMQAFNNSCSSISISNNVFPCDTNCSSFNASNINPINYQALLGPITNFSTDNTCKRFPHKPVTEAMREISINCGLLPTPTLPPPSTTELTTTELPETTTDVSTTSDSATTSFNEEIITASAFTGDTIILPLSIGAVLLIMGAVAATFWIYKKRKGVQETPVATYHHNSRNFDHDRLIDDPDDEEDAITIQAI